MMLKSSLGALSFAAALFAADSASAPIRFEDATAPSGINFRHSIGSQKLGSLVESTGAGCVWFDYNGDGKADLFVPNGRALDPGMHPYPLAKLPPTPPHNHLYRNDGAGKFTDVTAQAKVGGRGYSFAASAADYDRDGRTDLLVGSYGYVTLYRNLGNGAFQDVTAAAGLNVTRWAISSTWLDYDRDGCLDLFIGRYVKFDPKYRAFYPADNYPGPLDYEGDTNLLYRNNCKGAFTDVSEQSGIAAYKGRTMSVTSADFDRDGYPDIYVANDKTENFFFHNQKNGTFNEVAVNAGVAFGQNGESTSAMGPVAFDLDNDGRLDLWVTDAKYNRLLRNMGQMSFSDISHQAGISQWNAQYASWGTGAADFNNDGWNDLLIFHGGLIHMVPQEHSLFQNSRDGKFVDVSTAGGPIFEGKSVARGACFADFANDGRIGAFLVNLGTRGQLWRNVTQPGSHWLTLQLVGTKSNPDGIGALVEVITGETKQQAERVASSGYLGQDDWRLHFGLGTAAKADKITVTWPSGTVQQIDNVAGDRILTIREPQ